MKTYIINLKKDVEKRLSILAKCKTYNIVPTFIDAVNGKSLSLDFIQEHVYKYPECALTLGEIGCALSHIKVYQTMVENKVQWALILEDDAEFKDDVRPIFNKIIIEDRNIQPCVYLMSKPSNYIKSPIYHVDKYTIYPMLNASCAHGYIINLKAAKLLCSELMPIKYEADRWGLFSILFKLKLYCIDPIVIDTTDHDKSSSRLEMDRRKLVSKRNKFVKKLKRMNKIKYLKYVIRKYFINKFRTVVDNNKS